MSPAVIVTLILIIGIGLVMAAAMADRRSAARAEGADLATMDEAGRRTRPAADRQAPLGPPAYVTTDQLLRNAPAAGRFTPDQERDLASRLAAPSTVRVECQLATSTLATHTGERAILDQPRVLVCADGITRLREILPLLGTASADMRPLLIAAPTIDADVLETIIANKLGGKLQICVVLGQVEALEQLATATGSTPVVFADRQTGAVVFTELGQPATIVADRSACWVISAT